MIELDWKISPRRWQEYAYKAVLECHRKEPSKRMLVQAIMGAGKSILIAQIARTWALGLPAACSGGSAAGSAADKHTVVITTPTEHLVVQLYDDVVATGTRAKVGVYYGRKKQSSADIIICCNPSIGSLCDALQAAGRKVGLLICDEAHRTEGEVTRNALARLSPQTVIGFTATPFLSDESGSLSLFDQCVYRYDVAAAVADGDVIVPMEIRNAESSSVADNICLGMIHAADGVGVCTAKDVADAREYAAYLTANGVESEAVYAEGMVLTERIRILNRLRDAHIRCVVFVRLLTEGVNLPWLRWLCFRLPITSRVAFAQMAGRILRTSPGKDKAVFLDPHGLFDFHSLSYKEALGEVEETPKVTIEDAIEAIGKQIQQDVQHRVHGIEAAESMASRLMVAAECCLGVRDRTFVTKIDRLRRSTQQQHSILELVWGTARAHVPSDWRPYFDGVLRAPSALRFGPKANLIQALAAIGEKRRFPQIDMHGCIGVPVKRGQFDFEKIGAM